jgi:DNA-methyltransferase (dcm)
MKRHADDSRNELYKMLIKVIKEKKPKFFVAENVKGILSLEHGEVIKLILQDFENLGYKVQKKVLNAADYGVPQLRNRVIIVGVRKDIDFDYEYPKQTHSENGENGLKKWVTVGEAMSGIPDPDQPNDVLNHTYSQFKLKFNGYLGNRAINPDKPAPTVTARGDDKGGVVVLHHPNNKRRMTCRELAAVQSFPLDFEFCGNRSSIYRQIGNAVPPLLGKAVAKQFNRYKGEK